MTEEPHLPVNHVSPYAPLLDADRTRRIELVSQWTRKLELDLSRGNVAAAERCFEQAVAALVSHEKSTTSVVDTPLGEVGVALRTANALEEHLGVTTVGDLLGVTREQVLGISGFAVVMYETLLAELLGYVVRRCLEHERYASH
ncbi:MAG: hypothetical protein ACPGWS_01400 [Solirubrobacterales bacterium]